jgi:hypothetical protein
MKSERGQEEGASLAKRTPDVSGPKIAGKLSPATTKDGVPPAERRRARIVDRTNDLDLPEAFQFIGIGQREGTAREDRREQAEGVPQAVKSPAGRDVRRANGRVAKLKVVPAKRPSSH